MGRGRRGDVTDVPREKKERNACVRYPTSVEEGARLRGLARGGGMMDVAHGKRWFIENRRGAGYFGC